MAFMRNLKALKHRVTDIRVYRQSNSKFAVKSFVEYSDVYNYTMDEFVSNYIENEIISLKTTSKKMKFDNLLFIGAGPNPSISNLIPYFDQLFLVEPNQYYHDQWQSFDWFNNEKVIKIADTFENLPRIVNYNDVQFDYISSSHVLYYLTFEQMLKTAKLMNAYLSAADHSKCIISIAKDPPNGCHCSHFAQSIQPQYGLSELIEKTLKSKKFNIENIVDEESEEIKDKTDLTNVLSMHLKDYIIDNTDYDKVVKMSHDEVENAAKDFISNNLNDDMNNSKNVIYHHATRHFFLQKTNI